MRALTAPLSFSSSPQGESLAYVREQMGHHSIRVTVDTYGHLVPGGNEAAMDRLDDTLTEGRRADRRAGQMAGRHEERIPLLRMSDLLALQPNLDINLYLVAPDERRAKVEQEILRPTFALRERPLPEVCGFLSFSKLVETAEGIRRLGLAASLKPDFLLNAAEFFGSDAR